MTTAEAPTTSPTAPDQLNPTVLIIGGGPAGLSAATALAPKVAGTVLVVGREAKAGGIPRHSDHPGYGIRDVHRFISGPTSARLLRKRAVDAGAVIVENAMVTDWAGDRSVKMTSPNGRFTVTADVVVLATGARERPRPARVIPGDRADGVYTTGNLQNLVHLKRGAVGRRAVVVGAELVSWSAALTLKHVDCSTVLMTTEYPKPDAYFFFSRPGKSYFRTRVATRTRVTTIIGRPKVTGVEIENLDTGERRTVACDTVILTGSWIPDNELARSAGIRSDSASKSPLVDAALRTNKDGVFAIGNLLHPVDTADIAAIDGVAVARHVLDYLDGTRPTGTSVELLAEAPFRWVAPRVLRQEDPAPPRNRLLLWTDRYVPFPQVVLRQNGTVIAGKRLLWPSSPGRVFRVPSSILDGVDYDAGSVTIGLA